MGAIVDGLAWRHHHVMGLAHMSAGPPYPDSGNASAGPMFSAQDGGTNMHLTRFAMPSHLAMDSEE